MLSMLSHVIALFVTAGYGALMGICILVETIFGAGFENAMKMYVYKPKEGVYDSYEALKIHAKRDRHSLFTVQETSIARKQKES